jgi:hypothetical protein
VPADLDDWIDERIEVDPPCRGDRVDELSP